MRTCRRTNCLHVLAASVLLALAGCRSGPKLAASPQETTSGYARSGAETRGRKLLTVPRSSVTSAPHRSDVVERFTVAWRPGTRPSERLLAGPRLGGIEAEVARWVADERLLLYPPAPPRRWLYIILHHSASEDDSLETIDRFHREERGWDGCGYHFVIGNGTLSGDGEIQVSERWLEQKHGAHTKVDGHPEYNQNGIGICLVGNFEKHRPTRLQIEAARTLVAYLAWRYQIPRDHITTHGRLAHGRTACPGRYFPEELILSP